MNPVLRVLKNSTSLSASVLLERAITFLLPWYVARIEGPEVWGQYSTALAFVMMGGAVAFWGLDQLLPREIARKPDRSADLLANAALIGAGMALLTTAVIALIVSQLNYEPYVQYLIIIGVAVTLLPRTEAILCEALINGIERMEWIIAVRLPLTVLRIVASIYLLMQGYGVEVLFFMLALYHATAVLVYLGLFYRYLPHFRLRVDTAFARVLFVQALPFVAIISIGETFKQLDRVFLSTFWNTDMVGIYATGIMAIQVMYMIAPAIMAALFPVLARTYVATPERFAMLVSQLFKLIGIGIFPVMLAVITLAEFAIILVFGPAYQSSVIVLQIAALGILPSFTTRFLYRTMLASNHEHIAMRVAIINSSANLVLNLLLIPRFGVIGAAVVMALTELIGLVQNLYYLSGVTAFDYRRSLLQPGLVVGVGLLVYVALMGWNLYVAWLGATAVFGLGVVALRLITRQDLVLLTILRPKS